MVQRAPVRSWLEGSSHAGLTANLLYSWGMTRPQTWITGPYHPIIKALHDAERRVTEFRHVAKCIMTHHTLHADSSDSVYRVDSPTTWSYVGPAEQYGHLVTGLDARNGYVRVAHGQGGSIALATRLAFLVGERTPVMIQHMIDAADLAAPMIAATFVLGIEQGTYGWDSGETVMEAAIRTARDTAHERCSDPTPRKIWESTFIDGYVVEEIARKYLERREAINIALAEQGIRWGQSHLLNAAHVAKRVGLALSTWTAHVSRGEAPSADGDRVWRATTVDAWRLSQPRATLAGW